MTPSSASDGGTSAPLATTPAPARADPPRLVTMTRSGDAGQREINSRCGEGGGGGQDGGVEPDVPGARVAVQDGGAARAVVAASFLNNLLFEGTDRSYGVLYRCLLTRYSGTAQRTALVKAVFNFVSMILAPVSSLMMERYHYRGVVALGTVIMAAAIFMTSFAPSLTYVLFTYGALAGVGAAFIYVPKAAVINLHFDQYRGRALAAATVGGYIGIATFSHMMAYLLDSYTFSGFMLIMAGVTLNHAVAAALYMPSLVLRRDPKPSPLHTHTREKAPLSMTPTLGASVTSLVLAGSFHSISLTNNFDKTDVGVILHKRLLAVKHSTENTQDLLNGRTKSHSISSGTDCLTTRGSKDDCDSVHSSMDHINHKITGKCRDDNGNCAHRDLSVGLSTDDVPGENLHMLDHNDNQGSDRIEPRHRRVLAYLGTRFHMLRDIPFLLYCLHMFSMPFGISCGYIFLPSLAAERGVSEDRVALPLTVVSLASMVGTFSSGFIFDLPGVKRRVELFEAAYGVLLGVAMAALGVCGVEFYSLMTLTCVYGFMEGSVFTQRSNAVFGYVRPADTALGLGVATFFQGIGNVTAPTLIGYVRDVSGTYVYCFVVGGLVMMTSSVMLIVTYFAKKCLRKRADITYISETYIKT